LLPYLFKKISLTNSLETRVVQLQLVSSVEEQPELPHFQDGNISQRPMGLSQPHGKPLRLGNNFNHSLLREIGLRC
jgi:hypothetical protein